MNIKLLSKLLRYGYIVPTTVALFLFPAITFAAPGDIQGYLVTISLFIKSIIIPFLFALALLFFLFNTARYFIIGAASDQAREKAKRNALYGIAAFVFLLTLWGLVTVLVQGIGIEESNPLCPDYLQNTSGRCNSIQHNTRSDNPLLH